MFCPKKLKLNRFELVRIPSAKQLFSRFGMVSPIRPGAYTGDEPISDSLRKSDAVRQANEDYQNYCRSIPDNQE